MQQKAREFIFDKKKNVETHEQTPFYSKLPQGRAYFLFEKGWRAS